MLFSSFSISDILFGVACVALAFGAGLIFLDLKLAYHYFYVLKKRDDVDKKKDIDRLIALFNLVSPSAKQKIRTKNPIVSQYRLFEVKYITQKIGNIFDNLKTKFFKLNLEKLALTTSYQMICVLFLLYSTYILNFSEGFLEIHFNTRTYIIGDVYFLTLFLASFMGNIFSYKILSKIDILVKIPLLLSSMMYFVYSPCFICVEFLIYLPGSCHSDNYRVFLSLVRNYTQIRLVFGGGFTNNVLCVTSSIWATSSE